MKLTGAGSDGVVHDRPVVGDPGEFTQVIFEALQFAYRFAPMILMEVPLIPGGPGIPIVPFIPGVPLIPGGPNIPIVPLNPGDPGGPGGPWGP